LFRQCKASRGCAACLLRYRFGVCFEPAGELVFRKLAGGEVVKNKVAVLTRSGYGQTVHQQKGEGHNQRSAFVPVHERMIAGDFESVSGSKSAERRIIFRVRQQVLWARQSRFEQTFVANSVASTMFDDLPGVH